MTESSQIEVSIIVVTYNSIKWMHSCLGALINQDVDFQYEIIIVDNGSTDGTVDFITENYSTVRLIREENNGFGAGNNKGVQVATGRCLAFINPDTVADQQWLKNMIKPLEGERVVTTSKIRMLDEPLLLNCCGVVLL